MSDCARLADLEGLSERQEEQSEPDTPIRNELEPQTSETEASGTRSESSGARIVSLAAVGSIEEAQSVEVLRTTSSPEKGRRLTKQGKSHMDWERELASFLYPLAGHVNTELCRLRRQFRGRRLRVRQSRAHASEQRAADAGWHIRDRRERTARGAPLTTGLSNSRHAPFCPFGARRCERCCASWSSRAEDRRTCARSGARRVMELPDDHV